jgi:hypothetical protein
MEKMKNLYLFINTCFINIRDAIKQILWLIGVITRFGWYVLIGFIGYQIIDPPDLGDIPYSQHTPNQNWELFKANFFILMVGFVYYLSTTHDYEGDNPIDNVSWGVYGVFLTVFLFAKELLPTANNL